MKNNMVNKVLVKQAKLPVIRTMGRKYSNWLELNSLVCLKIQGVDRQQLGYIRSLTRKEFVLDTLEGITTYKIEEIEMMCL